MMPPLPRCRRLIATAATALALVAVMAFSLGVPGRGRGWSGSLPAFIGAGRRELALTLGTAQNYHTAAKAPPEAPEPFCSTCHITPPHERTAWSRAMLNHHASRMHCLVCHGRSFVDPSRDIGWRGKILWPRSSGDWLDTGREKEWRESVTRGSKCFAKGPPCADCHRADGPMRWRDLGYDEKRAARLGGLEESLTRTTEEKWFFPSIF